LHFEEGHLAQTYYTQFTNRQRQRSFENLAALGSDIEQLSRLAYSDHTKEVRDKIACAQFIAALTDGFIKRTLQFEGINSLRTALERDMAIKTIQGNSFVKDNSERNAGKVNLLIKIAKIRMEPERKLMNFKGRGSFHLRKLTVRRTETFPVGMR